MFYETPVSSDLKFNHDSGKVGRIFVEGRALTAQEIIKELEWIVPGEHQWDLRAVGDAYRVVFPSKADLVRLRKIQKIPIEATKMFLLFQEWSAADLDLFELTKTWVRVSGCPYKLRCDCLALFAVGSLIGKTQEVDMAFTRQHSVARMRVLVTDLKFIPNGIVDHVYDGVGYGIVFKIEGDDEHAKEDIPMAEAEGDDDNEPRSDPPEGEKLKEGPVIGNSTSMIALPKSTEGADGGSGGLSGGGVKRAAPTVITTPAVIPSLVERGTKVDEKGGNHAASVPQRVRVGQIECVDESISPKSAPPRLLWGDREDEERLPSPMSPFSPKSSRSSDSMAISDDPQV
jgi:hypothetical protein